MPDSVWTYERRRVIVTGAASGMGEATARAVLGLGGEVHALDLDEPAVAVTAFHRADLRDPRALERAVEAVGPPVHALFNCAGLPNTFPATDVMLVNFAGLRFLTERVIAQMPPGSAIASVSSVAGLGWMQEMGAVTEVLAAPGFEGVRRWCDANPGVIKEGYAFSKMCIIVYTMQRSPALAAQGIRINCTCPGPTDTPMMPHFEMAMGKDYMDKFPKPLGRNAQPDEQAWPLVFLNSQAASYITGTALFCDGGFTGALLTGQVDPTVLAPTTPTVPSGA